MALAYLLLVVFKSYSNSLVSIYEEKSSATSTVAFKFVVNTLPSVKEEDLLKSIKTLFGSGDTFVFHGLIDLKIVVSSLEVSGSVVKCADVNLCVSGGDLFALCIDDSAKGPTCTCSSGFPVNNGVCNECKEPLACGIEGTVCTNKPGSFDCKCPAFFIHSLNGCIDPVAVAAKDPCAELSASSKCLAIGASCVKDLSDDFFACRCSFPLVSSTVPGDNTCVDVTKTDLVAVDAKVDLAGVVCSYKLADITSGEALVLKEQVEALVQHQMNNGLSPSILCIEDLLRSGNDIGGSSYGALYVREAFRFAHNVLTAAVGSTSTTFMGPNNRESILGRIIRITDDVIAFREWVRTQFPVSSPVSGNPVSEEDDDSSSEQSSPQSK